MPRSSDSLMDLIEDNEEFDLPQLDFQILAVEDTKHTLLEVLDGEDLDS